MPFVIGQINFLGNLTRVFRTRFLAFFADYADLRRCLIGSLSLLVLLCITQMKTILSISRAP